MMSDDGERKNDGQGVPVGEILVRVSHEVRLLSDTAGDLQNLIGNLVVAGAFGPSHSIYELQSLDRLCQSLGAVADFLQVLSDGTSNGWKIDATHAMRTVKLADISERLTGQKIEADEATGEFEEFDSWPMSG